MLWARVRREGREVVLDILSSIANWWVSLLVAITFSSALHWSKERVQVTFGCGMQKPKILMIGWEYPPHNSGGLGVACDGLTRALYQQNAQIYFTLPYTLNTGLKHLRFLPCADTSWSPQEYVTGGIASSYGLKVGQIIDNQVEETVAAHFDSSELRALPQSELDDRVTQYAELVATRARPIHKLIDVIHAHDWMSFPAGERVARESRKPFIAHVHSTEYDRVPHGYGSSFIQAVEKRGLERANQVIAVSQFTKQMLVKHYGIASSRIAVIHNGIDPLPSSFVSTPPASAFAPSRPVIVFMGRLTMQKGGEYFLRLAQAVRASLPNALFIVAGNGDLYHQLLFHTAAEQLTAQVLFSGFVRDRQRDLLLERADVFVMPSLSEPFGLVALEAAQRLTPVIVSKQSGVAEVLPSAIQLDFWDSEQMARSIVALIREPHYANQLIQQQLKDMERVTWNSAASKVLTLYRQVFRRPLA